MLKNKLAFFVTVVYYDMKRDVIFIKSIYSSKKRQNFIGLIKY